MTPDTITLPDGTEVERLFKCADCWHISDTHDSRQIGAKRDATCENCGEASLMLHPGDPIDQD